MVIFKGLLQTTSLIYLKQGKLVMAYWKESTFVVCLKIRIKN